jgi:LysM repeat protein
MTNRSRIVPVIFLVGAAVSWVRADDPSTNAAAVSPPAVTPIESTTAPASTAAPAPPTATDAAINGGERPTTYTVVAGDTLWDLSHKFNTSIRAIKKLNKLKKDHLKPGQVIKIPPVRTTTAKPTASSDKTAPEKTAKISAKSKQTVLAAKTRTHHNKLLVAQPVQDFDIPTSTFASCPTPPSNGADEIISAPEETAPVPDSEISTPKTQASPEINTLPPLAKDSRHGTPATPSSSAAAKSAVARGTSNPLVTPPANKSFATAIADFFGGSRSNASESGAWGNRFLTETRSLASRGIGYDQSWRPQGESRSWAMDCSNTSRYLYQVTAGIQLPRTASDQYYDLHLQNKAWDVPTVSNGFADCNFLRSNLKPGDLLFWENTYRPDRQPPITHVMIFLGTNAKGQWIMAGSQSSHGGQYNPHRSGPDVYVFNPTRPTGGYTTWMGLVHHQGRFCAYGRPLEADVKKLSVAAND